MVSVLLFFLLVAAFWFWVLTLLDLFECGVLWGLAGIFFSPFAQILYYFTFTLTQKEKTHCHVFFAVMGAIVVLGVIA